MADRFVAGAGSYRPDDPAPTDQRPYLEYLDRVERGEPTGRARMQLLHPNPPCHTGGGGPLSACPCMTPPGGTMTDQQQPAPVGMAALKQSANPAEVGHCGLCGQEMIRTADDCWHPHTVAEACPPEDVIDGVARPRFGEFFRPGRQHWMSGAPTRDDPAATLDDLGIPFTTVQLAAAGVVPKVVEATLTVRSSDGSEVRVTFHPEEADSLEVTMEAQQPTVDVDIRMMASPLFRQGQHGERHRLEMNRVGRVTFERLVRG